MNFILQGRDQLSRIFDRAGDSATRMGRRLTIASINSSAAINRFQRDAASRLASVQTSTNKSGEAFDALKKTALSLAPAIIPVAAAMAPLVASTGAAGVAVGVYTAALGPQIAAMGEASQAEKKYKDAVDKSGRTSKEAVAAHEEYRQAMAKLPPETRRATAALSVLKDQYKSWSDGLAKDTMGPVVKGMAIFGGLLPKLTPLVKGTSSELNRMMTILAGGMQSPAVDRLIKQFTEFSTGALRRANDALVHLMRTLDTGKVGGGLSEFMNYARTNGPLVGEVLRNIGTALLNLLKAASDVGVGMLQAVNALAKLVAAVPPGVITVLLQLAVAIKAVQLAALGLVAARGAIAAFGVQLVAMQTAAAAAPGRLAALGAAFGALSRTAKLAVAGTAIGLLILGLMRLSSIGKQAPPDVDRLTTALGNLGRTGKVAGEAAKAFGADLDGLAESLRVLARPSVTQSIEKSFSDFLGYGSGGPAAKRAAADLDAVDKALSNLVKGGKAGLAQAAFDQVAAAMRRNGMTTAELRAKMDDYKSALADAAFEQQLAAQAMGLFGAQAQAVQAKLAAQKQSMDGLRQSLFALNDAVLMARGGVRGMEVAIDAASKAAKENGKTLDENTEKGRNNNEALDQLASSTMRAAAAVFENTGSWSASNRVLDRGRGKLIESARAMGLTQAQAKRLADQILRTPDKTARLKGNMQDLQSKLNHAKNQLKRVPDSRKAEVRARIAQLEAAIRKAKRDIASVHGKTVTITTHYRITKSGSVPAGTYHGSTAGRSATGGLIRGPGTSTSDSIPRWLSDYEYVIPAKRVKQFGVPFFDAIRAGQMGMAAQAGRSASPTIPAGRPAAGRGGAGPTVIHNEFHIHGAIDATRVGREIETVLATYQRGNGGAALNFKTKS